MRKRTRFDHKRPIRNGSVSLKDEFGSPMKLTRKKLKGGYVARTGNSKMERVIAEAEAFQELNSSFHVLER